MSITECIEREPPVWGFRIASSAEAGAGHMMRCLALAEALEDPVVFFLDPHDTWGDRLHRRKVPWRREADVRGASQMLAALASGQVDASLFDGYRFDASVVNRAAGLGFCVEIDDLGGPARAHAVVNPGLGVEAAAYDLPPARILCGPSFALLGREYAAAHGCAAGPAEGRGSQTGPARSLLVDMGARDAVNATDLVLEVLGRAAPKLGEEVAVTVVLGADAPHLELVKKRAADVEKVGIGRVRVLAGVEDMVAVYRDADMAVGAGGMSLLERLCCGVASIVITQAENQAQNAEGAERLGAAVCAGSAGALDLEAVSALIVEFAADGEWRARLQAAGLALVDGRGARRAAQGLRGIYEAFCESQISL